MHKPVYFQDVSEGLELPPLEKGPWTNAHIARWCAAQENWERIHYDYLFATKHDGLPDVVANGNWRKYAMAQLFKDWAGQGGWLWKLFMRYRGMQLPGDVLTCWAKITSKYEVAGLGLVELDCGMKNQDGKETTPGTAIVVLPLRGGQPVPYPFVPPPGLVKESPFQRGRSPEKLMHLNNEILSYIGKEAEEVETWDEITKTELRRLAQAIPDTDPIYWDEEQAKKTKFKTLVAPPLFPVDAFKPAANMPDRLTVEMKKDLNFWGGPPGDFRVNVRIPLPLKRILNAGQEFEIFQLARLGEKLRAKSHVADIYEKQGASGRMIVTCQETFYKNSQDEVILKAKTFAIYR